MSSHARYFILACPAQAQHSVRVQQEQLLMSLLQQARATDPVTWDKLSLVSIELCGLVKIQGTDRFGPLSLSKDSLPFFFYISLSHYVFLFFLLRKWRWVKQTQPMFSGGLDSFPTFTPHTKSLLSNQQESIHSVNKERIQPWAWCWEQAQLQDEYNSHSKCLYATRQARAK